jgi:hypothetical protein
VTHPLQLPHVGTVTSPPVPSATFHSAAITAIVTLPPVLLPVSQRNNAARFLTASADGMVSRCWFSLVSPVNRSGRDRSPLPCVIDVVGARRSSCGMAPA